MSWHGLCQCPDDALAYSAGNLNVGCPLGVKTRDYRSATLASASTRSADITRTKWRLYRYPDVVATLLEMGTKLIFVCKEPKQTRAGCIQRPLDQIPCFSIFNLIGNGEGVLEVPDDRPACRPDPCHFLPNARPMHGPGPSSIALQAGPDCTRVTDFLYAGPCYRVRVLCRLGSLRRASPSMLRSRLLASNRCTNARKAL
jgi:hypothetical protein